jgi:DNA-binding response OmpR family regulator
MLRSPPEPQAWLNKTSNFVEVGRKSAQNRYFPGETVWVSRRTPMWILVIEDEADLLIVDWRLPKQDGKTLVQRLREQGKSYPILMLTALGGVPHRVAGLDAGADDYLTKPFSFEELLARLRSLRRRMSRAVQDAHVQVGALHLDTARHCVTAGDTPLLLRPKEYALLELFMRQPDVVFSRTVLAERVWGAASYVSDHVIDVTISTLRKKLQEAQAEMETIPAQRCPAIETIRGVGYRLVVR